MKAKLGKKLNRFLVLLTVMVMAVMQLNILTASAADKTGWVQSGSKWYFYDAEGDKTTGWLQNGGRWYYLDSKGVMQTGWKKIDGKQYYLDGSGAMQTGWLQSGSKWYFFDGSGVMKTGWLQNGGKWYYLDSKGVMQTGQIKVDGKTYQLDANGVWQDNSSGGSSGGSTNKKGTSSAILPDLGEFYKLDRTYSDSDYMKNGNYKKYIRLPISELETVRKETLALLQEDRYQLELVGEQVYDSGEQVYKSGTNYYFRYTGTNPDVKLLEKEGYKFNLQLAFEPKDSGVFLCTILYSDEFDIVDSGKKVSADLSSANSTGGSSGSGSGGGSYSGDGIYTPDASKLPCLTCGGDGDCNSCGGYGYTGFGDAKAKCYSCRGYGKCRTCGGTGTR